MFTNVGLKNIKYNSEEILINFIICLDFNANSFIIVNTLFSINCIIFVFKFNY